MDKVDRRSALAIGLAAASAAVVKPAAAQTTDYKDTTVAPGIVVRAYSGETASIIPGFKTVSLRDIIVQPGSKQPENTVMMNAMVCHITEGELQVFQEGKTLYSQEELRLDLQQGYERIRVQCGERDRNYADHRPQRVRFVSS